jgi:hypothetical protein
MKKYLLSAVCCLLSFAALDAAPDYNATNTARPGMQVNRIGAAATGRPTVPVTTTTTTNTYIPETNFGSSSTSTYELDIDGQRAACLLTAGNIWASKLNANPEGIPITSIIAEDADPAQNACFTSVQTKSADIKNMGRFFPPRYFQQGAAVECGSWLDQAVLDEAILDAKKTPRVVGTVAASVGGAAAGIALTEVIGRNLIHGFEGQKDYYEKSKDSAEALRSLKCDTRTPENAATYQRYEGEMRKLAALCSDPASATAKNEAEVGKICEEATAIAEVMNAIPNC